MAFQIKPEYYNNCIPKNELAILIIDSIINNNFPELDLTSSIIGSGSNDNNDNNDNNKSIWYYTIYLKKDDTKYITIWFNAPDSWIIGGRAVETIYGQLKYSSIQDLISVIKIQIDKLV